MRRSEQRWAELQENEWGARKPNKRLKKVLALNVTDCSNNVINVTWQNMFWSSGPTWKSRGCGYQPAKIWRKKEATLSAKCRMDKQPQRRRDDKEKINTSHDDAFIWMWRKMSISFKAWTPESRGHAEKGENRSERRMSMDASTMMGTLLCEHTTVIRIRICMWGLTHLHLSKPINL